MTITRHLAFLSVFLVTTIPAYGASLEKAKRLETNGLLREAKVELVDLIFEEVLDAQKAEAYYMLGNIAFEENDISAALANWRNLSKKFPASAPAVSVRERLSELAEIVGESTNEKIGNAVALSYLRHGDFWSKGKDYVFTIDSSWIPNVTAACKWYDRVIAEFPGTTASRIAYEGKLRTLFGWEEPGKHGRKHGIKSNFTHFIPYVLKTFEKYSQEHPASPSLQAFRYQIAQGYWRQKDWANTRIWLKAIIEVSDDSESFYRDLAERRLEKIEY